MPLEDLLAMYGGHFGENPETTTDDAVPLEEIKPEPLPPLVEASDKSQEQTENPVMSSEERAEEMAALAPSPLSPASYAETPPSPSPSSPPTSQTGNLFPENQRITRGCELSLHELTFHWKCIYGNHSYLASVFICVFFPGNSWDSPGVLDCLENF